MSVVIPVSSVGSVMFGDVMASRYVRVKSGYSPKP
jgi:hypothetical protein